MTDKIDTIARLNDQFRRSIGKPSDPHGQVYLSRGIADLPLEDQLSILTRVRYFDRFTKDNDPYGEHDFGALQHQDIKVFWKINYYDTNLKYHSPDPADPQQTKRVLVIMQACEY